MIDFFDSLFQQSRLSVIRLSPDKPEKILDLRLATFHSSSWRRMASLGSCNSLPLLHYDDPFEANCRHSVYIGEGKQQRHGQKLTTLRLS